MAFVNICLVDMPIVNTMSQTKVMKGLAYSASEWAPKIQRLQLRRNLPAGEIVAKNSAFHSRRSILILLDFFRSLI